VCGGKGILKSDGEWESLVGIGGGVHAVRHLRIRAGISREKVVLST
jgi:hypothetical protein